MLDGGAGAVFFGQERCRLVIDATGEVPIEVTVSMAKERDGAAFGADADDHFRGAHCGPDTRNHCNW